MKKSFTDIEVGDVIICYDNYSRNYTEHKMKVINLEFDKENITKNNPKGLVAYCEDLGFDEEDDEYLTRADESNFICFVQNSKFDKNRKEE